MRVVRDIEHRLRATAVDPGVRSEHFDALRAELQARFRRRRRNRGLVTACLALLTFMVFQETPLESTSYRLDYTDVLDDSTAVFKTYADAKTAIVHSQSTDWAADVLTPEMVADARRNLELELALFASGQMNLHHVDAYTYKGRTEYSCFYRTEYEGETIWHLELVDHNTDPDFESFLSGGGLDHLTRDYAHGDLTELLPESRIVEGYRVTFQRWLDQDPEHGEVILWRSTAIN